ncbi:hypothetical protein D3C81_1438420 [compost metagenome]
MRHDRPGWIVWIADPDRLRFIPNAGEHSLQIVGTILQRHFDADGPFDIGIALIHAERLIRHHRLVARQEKRASDQGDNFIRTAAENNLFLPNAKLAG